MAFFMRNIFTPVFLVFCFGSLWASVSMKRVNPHLFVNAAKTDFTSIIITDKNLKRELVRDLFETDVLMHENSHAYNRDASFDSYYAEKQNNFSLMDLNGDGKPELIFQGYVIAGDDKESVEIYAATKGKYSLIYNGIGYLIAYKIQPNTKEIVLFQHQYPCCSSLSHNIYTLRFLENTIKSKSKYFLARDEGMKGSFFPDSCHFGVKFKKLTKKTMLYWSDGFISKNATPTLPTNELIHYPKGSIYQELARRNGWSYILIRGNTVSEKSASVNGENMSKMAVFAWIKTQ